MLLTKRTALDTGHQCNINCKFCYYANSHEKNKLSTSELKKRIKKAKYYGADSIEFTGGEPTIRKDIFELIEYAKMIGLKRLGIITNGITFSNFDFVKRIKKAGIEEVKFSIHGPNPKIHDALTKTKGSFKKLIIGARNAKKVGLKITTNTVITQTNFKSLLLITKILDSLKPRRINFEFLNPISDAKKLKKDIIASYSKTAPYLHKALDVLIAKRYNITVRYVPFCFIQGYERYVCNFYQVQYDPDEWDYRIKDKIEYSKPISTLNLLAGGLNFLKTNHLLKQDFIHALVIQSKLLRFTIKPKQCKKCMYELICDGLWKAYAKLYSCNEVYPLLGRKITNPTYFLKKLK